MRWWLLLVAGCGRIGFDESPLVGDGATDATDDVASATPCLGTTHLATDNFDDGLVDAALWGNAYSNAPTYYEEKFGTFNVVIAPNSAGRYAGYVTSVTRDFREDRVFVEMAQVPTPVGLTALHVVQNLGPAREGFSLEFEAGTVLARSRRGGTITDHAMVAFDGSSRWWQLRERGGRVLWQVSGDAVAWRTIFEAPTQIDVSAMYMTLSAGIETNAPMPTDARFDNFNGGGAPPDCP